MGTGLRPVEAYEDLFLFRDAAQRWLSDSRPRDAHNTHPLRTHGGRDNVHEPGARVAFAPHRRFGRPPDARNSKRTVNWYVHCFLHCDPHGGDGDGDGDGDGGAGGGDTRVPLSEDVLDGLQVGGARNYGFGRLSVADSQVIDVSALAYSRLRDAEAYVLELVSPYVLSSTYPGADDGGVPGWWASTTHGEERPVVRRREACLVVDGERYAVETVDHGQVVAYAGDDAVWTARNGVTRVGTHSKYGFGELRVRPASDYPVRAGDASTATSGDATATGTDGTGGAGRDRRRDEGADVVPRTDRGGERS